MAYAYTVLRGPSHHGVAVRQHDQRRCSAVPSSRHAPFHVGAQQGGEAAVRVNEYESAARPAAAAIQPAWRPITSRMKTLVEVSHIDATSRPASSVETATYFATDPKPGQVSVSGRSLSTVLGMWMACRG